MNISSCFACAPVFIFNILRIKSWLKVLLPSQFVSKAPQRPAEKEKKGNSMNLPIVISVSIPSPAIQIQICIYPQLLVFLREPELELHLEHGSWFNDMYTRSLLNKSSSLCLHTQRAHLFFSPGNFLSPSSQCCSVCSSCSPSCASIDIFIYICCLT